MADSPDMRHGQTAGQPGRLRARFRRRHRGDGGVAMIEAALVVPVFILLIFGIVEFSGYVSAKTAANAAVKAGARMAVVQGNSPMADREILHRMSTEGAGLVASNDVIEEIKIWKADSVDDDPPSNCSAATFCNRYVKPNQAGGAYHYADLPLTTDTDPAKPMGPDYADCYFGATSSTDLNCTGGPYTRLDGGWPPDSRRTLEKPPGTNTCNDDSVCPPDLVGIWIKVRHQYYTQFFGSSVTVESKTISAIEPQGYDR